MAYKNFIKGVVLFLFFVLFKSVILFADTSPNLIPVTVLNVIDGDTITVSLPNGKVERVRYLLIDTPELHHPFHGKEEFSERACRLNGQLLELGDILLEFDVEKRDRYGRLLAYVWCRSSKEMFLINEELVRRGAAMPLIILPIKIYPLHSKGPCPCQKRKGRTMGTSLKQAFYFEGNMDIPSLSEGKFYISFGYR